MFHNLEMWAQAHAVLTGIIVTYFLAPAVAKGLELLEAKLETTKLSAFAAILRSYGFDAGTLAHNFLHLIGVADPDPVTAQRMLGMKKKPANDNADKTEEEKKAS